ncbi:MAG: tRNA (adenosine(37)-N6)-threonylcarbamoyltransferase complex transferase subunit TsaD [Fimbriimonadaceae bacterium]
MGKAVALQFWPDPILAIETSCDETSVAIIHGREILANVVASQIDMHIKWGGVVPEAAARQHVESILPVYLEAMAKAGEPKLSAVCVTNRPGLVGALSVGVSAAKAIAFQRRLPILGVHHLEGHLMSPLGDPEAELIFPHIALIVSGGHTEIVQVIAPGDYKILGETRDDAAGEAFDKGARLLGLGYPGGFAIQEQAKLGNPKRYKLPRAIPKDPFNFSFSGLKTAMLRLVEHEGQSISIPDAAASLQAAIVDVLVAKTFNACEESGITAVTLVGGVSANISLRETLAGECNRRDISVLVPPLSLCTDNAAMIGLAGSLRLQVGERSDWSLEVVPNAELPKPPLQ